MQTLKMSICLSKSVSLGRTLSRCHSFRKCSQFTTPSLVETREKFRPWGEGSVDFESIDEASIGIIRLNHEKRRNAMSGKMMCELDDIVTKLEKEKQQQLKGLVFTGQGDFFCAGGDLSTVVKHLNSSQMGWEMACYMHNILDRLSKLPLISVAYVNGRALGGGAELPLATDLRAFSKTAGKISFVQARMGVTPGWSGATRLKTLLGKPKALEILLSCRTIGADEALKLGLCDKVVDDFDSMLSWLKELTGHDISVIKAIKSSVSYESATNSMQRSYLNERQNFAPLWTGPANKKALESNLKH